MTIRKICIVGLEDYAMLTRDNAYGYVGGESVQHVLLARAWRDLGLDVSIIVYDHGQPRVTMVDGIRAIAAFRAEDGLRGLRFFHPRVSGVIGAIRSVQADAYYQSPAGAWSGISVWCANRLGKPSILRIASDFDCIRGKQPMRLLRDRKLFDYGVLNATLLVAQSTQQRNLLQEHYGVPSEIVNIAVELPSDNAHARKDVDVIWVGNLRHIKRADLLIELAQRLPDYKFVLIGGSLPGHEGYFEDIRKRAAELPNVQMTGGISYEQVGSWFDRARVHVNTSDVEGFPNTFLQAWARSVPVVSFFDPDGVIQRRDLGRSCRTLEDMSYAVDSLLRVPDECVRIGVRARDFAMREFSPARIARQYLDLLEREAPAQAPARARA